MKARISAIITAIALALTVLAFTAPTVSATHNVCVTFYENSGLSGDRWTECGSSVGDANFTNNTNGLNNGCNGANWPLTNSSWNDCVSSFHIDNLDAGYKIQLYVNTNYGFENRCVDTNGDSSWNLGSIENDRTSSYRILSGNC